MRTCTHAHSRILLRCVPARENFEKYVGKTDKESMIFSTVDTVLINHYSEPPVSCGYFEPKISPIGQILRNFSCSEEIKFGTRKVELTGSTHVVHLIFLKIVPKERGDSILLESKVKNF